MRLRLPIFLATNPKAQQTLLESRGESLKSGLDNLMKDIQRGRISQTDETAFEVGRNVATSEGQVVFENALFQLIQYKPLTAKVYARPFVLVPPCINKYYILDLQPENSFIRHAVGRWPHRIRRVVEEPASARVETDVGRLPRAGRDQGDARRAADQRSETGQRARFLRRRHDPGDGAGRDCTRAANRRCRA